MERATSRDGTRIAFERVGAGRTVVIVAGLLCDRTTHRALAERLGERFTAVTYDRRGRGDSGDTPPYDVQREVEDLAAVIEATGGPAAVYGHSSGAGLALLACGRRAPITHLVLHEPPYGAEDDTSREEARSLAARVRAAVESDCPDVAIRRFLGSMGMPEDAIEAAAADRRMLHLARTMPYDHSVMDDDAGGTIPVDAARRVSVPTLVVAGDKTADFFRHAAEQLVQLIPNARLQLLRGSDHGAPAEVVAPVIADFCAAS